MESMPGSTPYLDRAVHASCSLSVRTALNLSTWFFVGFLDWEAFKWILGFCSFQILTALGSN